MTKGLYIIGAFLIAGFVALGIMEMREAATPYVTTVAEIKKMDDRTVQFIGNIVKGKTRYDDSTDQLHFVLKDDKGDPIAVRYHGVMPANFNTAEQAVVRGSFRDSELVADQVLTKCPSKYRGK